MHRLMCVFVCLCVSERHIIDTWMKKTAAAARKGMPGVDDGWMERIMARVAWDAA